MARPSRKASPQARRTLRATPALEAPPRQEPSAPSAPSRGVHLGPLPAEVARLAQREMDRLRKLPAGSPDAAHVRAYLQWLWTTPWHASAGEDADLRQVQAGLEQGHLGLSKAKERILEYLAVRQLKHDLPGPALCIVGPHGTGKTSLGSEVARALRRPFARVNVSGTSDAAELAGEPRTMPGAQPGKIVRALRSAGVRNPVLLIDGVDRLVGEGGHGVAEVLLELLDPESAAQFTDHYLGVPIDLSHAVIIMCANALDQVPDSLQERIEVIEVPGYSEDEKLEIARRFLVRKQMEQAGLSAEQIEFEDKGLEGLIQGYTREAGVRNLEREKIGRAHV